MLFCLLGTRITVVLRRICSTGITITHHSPTGPDHFDIPEHAGPSHALDVAFHYLHDVSEQHGSWLRSRKPSHHDASRFCRYQIIGQSTDRCHSC